MAYQVSGSRAEGSPSAARWRELTGKMPNASVTEFGNVNVKARAGSRRTRSACLVEDSASFRGQAITRAGYERVAALQDAHRAAWRTVAADGFIGSDPKLRTRARLIMETAKASASVNAKASASIDASATGIVTGAIEWTGDPGFGCDVAAAVPGRDESLVTSLG